MSFLSRARQTCREDHRPRADVVPVGQGPCATAYALRGHPPMEGAAGALRGQDPRLALNRVFLSGILVADPQKDRSRDRDPVTLLLVAFPAPDASDTQERLETASCEVEVPDGVADGKQLQTGGSIFITGQLSGGGGVIATEIHVGPPPEEPGRKGPSDRTSP
jgi:hypothetical protein